jgi:general stress protein YciG
MIHDISGTHPHATNDQSNPPSIAERGGHEEHASQELTPDRPPLSAASSEGKTRRPRGFGAMDRKLVSEIARKGGKAAHSAGTAHEFTSEEAREAGRKGGRATHAKRRQVAEGASLSKEPAKG